MAEIHKITKNGQTILPATTTDAVVHPDLQTPLTNLINEYNVSVLFPTSGIDGTDKYDLQTAIDVLDQHLSAEQKTVGIKVAFNTNSGEYLSYEYSGKGPTNIKNWTEVGINKIENIEDNTYIKNNFLEIDTSRLYFGATYDKHSGKVSCNYDGIQAVLYLKFTGNNSKYIYTKLLDPNVKITNIAITYYDDNNELQSVGRGSNPYLDLEQYNKIDHIDVVFNTVDGVTKFSELDIQPFAEILCESKDKTISEFFNNDNQNNKIVIDRGRYYDLQLISKTAKDFGKSFINIFNTNSYYISSDIYSEAIFKIPNHKIGEKINIFVYVDNSQLNIDNETYGNIKTLTVRFQNEKGGIETVNLDGSYQIRKGWNCIWSNI